MLHRLLDLDVLIALRTAPSNSWANPVERIMSIVNIGLQGVGLMRQKMSERFEKTVANVNSIKGMREKLTSDELVQELQESLSFPIDLLNSQMIRLSLKENFTTFKPATKDQIDSVWQACLEVEKNLDHESLNKKALKDLESLQSFLRHCCVEGHY